MVLVGPPQFFPTFELSGGENTYSKPTCVWNTSRAHRTESMTGFSDPAAKGATVKGTRPAATALFHYVSNLYTQPQFFLLKKVPHGIVAQDMNHPPLKAPVIASMRWGWIRDGSGVIGGADDLLRQRRKNLLALGGVEGGNS